MDKYEILHFSLDKNRFNIFFFLIEDSSVWCPCVSKVAKSADPKGDALQAAPPGS